jgi:hypothetical protein
LQEEAALAGKWRAGIDSSCIAHVTCSFAMQCSVKLFASGLTFFMHHTFTVSYSVLLRFRAPDVRQSCLDFAAQHYNATTLLTTPQQSPTDVAQQLQHKLAAVAGTDAATGLQPDVVIDCVGMQQTLEAAVRVVAPGGKIVLVGMGSEQLQLPATLLTCKEVDLLGSFRCAAMDGLQRVRAAVAFLHM